MAPANLSVVGDGLVGADIWITKGRIEAVTACDHTSGRPGDHPGDGRSEIALAKSMVWARPVDCHTHIDKGQVWGRTQNRDGSFYGALDASAHDGSVNFCADDMRARARFILDCAVAHGTSALRTHVDAARHKLDVAFGVLSELAQEYRDHLHLQLAPFTGIGEDRDFLEHVAQLACSSNSGVLSAFVFRDPALEPFLENIFRLAIRHDLALDFHADETLDPDSHCLRAIAEAALRYRFEAPILVGHACALSVQSESECDRTLDLVHKAGIGIVALPLCNAYLQDRTNTTSPRRRGIAPLHEIAALGIPVAIASDNVRDPFHAYGDMDMAELYRQATPMMHLDHPVAIWPATVSTTPAAMIGRTDLGRLTAGMPADMIIFPARNWSEFCARPATDGILLRGGQVCPTKPPAFARLDHLKDMTK